MQNAEKNPLKLKPTNEKVTVLTVFWADNFNAKIDSDNKMINSTHMVAFQESTPAAIQRKSDVTLQKSRKKSVEPLHCIYY